MQLVAYGAQDVYLTGNPQITFFKVVYRRHTNFSIEVIEHSFNGAADFGRKVTACITRNGDLITRMYLRVKLPRVTAPENAKECECKESKFAWVRRLGHALIHSVELEIGGSRIDKQYGQWLDIWYELARNDDTERGYAKMIGDVPELTELSSPDADGVVKPEYTLYIPFQFWFNRNNGLALPLIALQYHEVRVHIEFRDFHECVVTTGDFANRRTTAHFDDATLLVDYIYLDSEERRRFAQVGHEYLIEQLQFTGEESVVNSSGKYKLGFNHPTKELVWAVTVGAYTNGHKFLAYSDTEDWSQALDAAAENVLVGLFNLDGCGNTDVNQSDDAKWEDVFCSPDGCSEPVGPGGAVVSGTFSGICLTVSVEEGFVGALRISKEGALLAQGAGKGGDLKEKIISGHVRLHCNGCVTVNTVNHELTIVDVSIPVSKYTDCRNDFSRNFCDVCVYQHHNYGMLIDGTVNTVERALLQLNGHDRFDVREGAYFNYVQTYQHHTNTPADGINVYSFALKPEEHQPSGTANLSRIDTTQLNLWFNDSAFSSSAFRANFFDDDTKLYIYGLNYNVLRIMSGMGGLAYSN